MEKIDQEKLCELYNMSDIDAFEYAVQFCEGYYKDLCEKLINLNNETKLGWGDKEYSLSEADEYYDGKEKLLRHFGIDFDKGEAFVGYRHLTMDELELIRRDREDDKDVEEYV